MAIDDLGRPQFPNDEDRIFYAQQCLVDYLRSRFDEIKNKHMYRMHLLKSADRRLAHYIDLLIDMQHDSAGQLAFEIVGFMGNFRGSGIGTKTHRQRFPYIF